MPKPEPSGSFSHCSFYVLPHISLGLQACTKLKNQRVNVAVAEVVAEGHEVVEVSVVEAGPVALLEVGAREASLPTAAAVEVAVEVIAEVIVEATVVVVVEVVAVEGALADQVGVDLYFEARRFRSSGQITGNTIMKTTCSN